LKIGFDAKRLFNNFTGLGNYGRTLVQSLNTRFPQHEYLLFTPKTQHTPRTSPFFDSQKYRIIMPKTMGAFWRTAFMTRHKEFNSLDVYHGLSHELPYGIARSQVLKIVTIHDLIFKYYPQDYKPADRFIYDEKFKFACQQADTIIAISQQTKEDIIHFYRISPEKIHVIYQSCDPIFLEPQSKEKIKKAVIKYKLPGEYMLYVGSVISRKNLGGIIEAMRMIPKDVLFPLVIIGSGKKYEVEVRQKIATYGLEESCIWIKPFFADFPAIYAGAKLFILPSFHEGFGIPLVEAMSVGTPVVTSNQSALKEIVGEAGLTISPENPAAIAESINRVINDQDLAKSLVQKGQERATHFLPDQWLKQIMNLYQR
jgi:glycosyltransferase involved in cell wall biosynthesis